MTTSQVLVVFHTVKGHTATVAQRIADDLRAAGVPVDVYPATSAPGPDGYVAAVVGGPIYRQGHTHELVGYLQRHAAALAAMPTALFQVSLTSANPDVEHTAQAESLVRDLLEETGLKPLVVGRFAGALAYTRYGWLTRRLMVSLAKRESGDVDTSRDYVYTDWAAVDRFARDVAELVTAPAAAGAPPD